MSDQQTARISIVSFEVKNELRASIYNFSRYMLVLWWYCLKFRRIKLSFDNKWQIKTDYNSKKVNYKKWQTRHSTRLTRIKWQFVAFSCWNWARNKNDKLKLKITEYFVTINAWGQLNDLWWSQLCSGRNKCYRLMLHARKV